MIPDSLKHKSIKLAQQICLAPHSSSRDGKFFHIYISPILHKYINNAPSLCRKQKGIFLRKSRSTCAEPLGVWQAQGYSEKQRGFRCGIRGGNLGTTIE
jgi:hypothetical protein